MIEAIPDADTVSRHIDSPLRFTEEKGLIWEAVFMFSGGKGESVVWRKYARCIEAVHRLGCAQEVKMRQSKPDRDFRYVGCISGCVGAIRAVAADDIGLDVGFDVVHDPSDNQGSQHAEVRYRFPEGRKLKSGEKASLKLQLQRVFGPRDAHTCVVS